MKPSATSKIIDKGADLGFPFEGAAPDLGYAEYRAPASVQPSANNNCRIWSADGKLIVSSSKAVYSQIFDITGQIQQELKLREGQNFISLQKGLYIVRIEGKSYKILI
jgi:hydroxyacyl-ACP dehydratase HTD2-like protein with hotdog domain